MAIGVRLFCAACTACAASAASADILVTVDPARVVGPIKIMNAVNNGPSKARADQSRGNFAEYRALRIPYARTHDSIRQATSNGHTVHGALCAPPEPEGFHSSPRRVAESHSFRMANRRLRERPSSLHACSDVIAPALNVSSTCLNSGSAILWCSCLLMMVCMVHDFPAGVEGAGARPYGPPLRGLARTLHSGYAGSTSDTSMTPKDRVLF